MGLQWLGNNLNIVFDLLSKSPEFFDGIIWVGRPVA
jgi:hypothetical protein